MLPSMPLTFEESLHGLQTTASWFAFTIAAILALLIIAHALISLSDRYGWLGGVDDSLDEWSYRENVIAGRRFANRVALVLIAFTVIGFGSYAINTI